MPDLGRRVLRSGKEFSAFDLAVGAPLEPAQFFCVEECLARRLDDQALCGAQDEPGEQIEPRPFWVNPDPPAPAPNLGAGPQTRSTLKKASKRRRREKRDSSAPAKSAAMAHRSAALAQAIRVDIDTAELTHAKPAWTGKRSAQDEHDHETGMGGKIYTREEIEALTGSADLRYVNWAGRISIPIIDSRGRIIAVLGGTPADVEGWKCVTDTAARLLERKAAEGSFTTEQLHHRRAQEPYPSLSRGISHGGGQTEPGELRQNVANTRITDDLLRDPAFQRLAGFADCLFRVFAPVLYAFYQAQMALIATWRPSLRWNFARSVFAACTFNFGPHAITVPHLDFGNLAWGWCAVTALGFFDPDVGGHLILWDLKLVIRFPPGSTILLPSALIRHSNVPWLPTIGVTLLPSTPPAVLFRWIEWVPDGRGL
ncbi:hypothetical protein C8R47DRAFT_1226640 [Mycena vitilis]|nr:hypothetical protein C8R47DRAFT_1226640 [Mycena vitilis]